MPTAEMLEGVIGDQYGEMYNSSGSGHVLGAGMLTGAYTVPLRPSRVRKP